MPLTKTKKTPVIKTNIENEVFENESVLRNKNNERDDNDDDNDDDEKSQDKT